MRRLLLIAAGGLVALAGCKKAAEARQERTVEPVKVQVAQSVVAPVQREVEITGTLFGDEEATVSAKVAGRIIAIQKDVGDRATPGEPLAQVDPTDYELAVAQKRMAMKATLAKLGLSEMPAQEFDLSQVPTVQKAQLESENAKAKFNRAQQLFEQKPPLISDQDYADIKTAFQVAQSNYQVELLTARSQLADARARMSELAAEEQRLRDATIRSPGDVEVAKMESSATNRYAIASRLVSVGEYVREGTPAFRLVANDPIKFRAQVPERFLSEVKVGQRVRVSVEAYRDPFEGTVARISPQVEVASRTFAVEMIIPNPNGRLQSGSFARGEILTRIEPDITLVPADAIVTFAGVTKVFTIEDGKAVEKKIETGQKVGDMIEIKTGLSGGAPIATTGAEKLATGTPVRTTAPGTNP